MSVMIQTVDTHGTDTNLPRLAMAISISKEMYTLFLALSAESLEHSL